jgi:hypothetical protein
MVSSKSDFRSPETPFYLIKTVPFATKQQNGHTGEVLFSIHIDILAMIPKQIVMGIDILTAIFKGLRDTMSVLLVLL